MKVMSITKNLDALVKNGSITERLEKIAKTPDYFVEGYLYHPESGKVNGTPIRGAGGVLLNERGITTCYTY